MTKPRRSSKQSGGTVLGVVLGLIVGLVIAVVVALYITRSPSPFVSKTPPAAPGAPNGATDPNRILQGKSPGQPAPMNTAPGQSTNQAQPGAAQEPQIIEVPPSGNASLAPVPGTRLPGAPELAAPQAPKPARAASLAEASATRAPVPASAASAMPGKAAPPQTAKADNNTGYVLQAGAYKTRTDAEQQRARLALQGFESKITERDTGGVTYYRVRVGPFTKLEDVNNVKQRLSDAGVETAIIRFQKQ